MQTITVLFWVSLAITLAGLAAALHAGRRGLRRRHVTLAPITLVLLALTIFLAERMGRARQFPPDQMRIHLWFAKSATGAALLVLITGLGLLRRPGWRRAHRIAVALFLLLAVTAVCTGIWVFRLSTPR